MSGFDQNPDKGYQAESEKTVDPSTTLSHKTKLNPVPPQTSEQKELQLANQQMRNDMELVTSKLEYEMECRKNQLYELDRLTMQLNKTHSDLQSVTLQRNSLQGSLKTMRRQKCYMVGLFEDLKHRHGELKQDYDFVSAQHNRTRAMLKQALHEREYWEARCKGTNHVVDDSPGLGNGSGNVMEKPHSLLGPRLNAVTMAAINRKKRNRREFEVGQTEQSMAVVSKKQYECARQSLEARATAGVSNYPVHQRRELFANVSKCTRE